jgi:lipopolysaccharide transport system ATP-binding protein
LFVTHSVDLIVRHCNRAILIDHGRILAEGEPKAVVHRYLDLLFGPQRDAARSPAKPAAVTVTGAQAAIGAASQAAGSNDAYTAFVQDRSPADVLAHRGTYSRHEFRWGHGGARILDAIVSAKSDGAELSTLDADLPARVAVRVLFERDCQNAIIGFTIKTPDGVAAAGTNSRDWNKPGTVIRAVAGQVLVLAFDFMPRLGSGDYLLSFGVAEDGADGVVPLDRRYDAMSITVIGPGRTTGIADLAIAVTAVGAE